VLCRQPSNYDATGGGHVHGDLQLRPATTATPVRWTELLYESPGVLWDVVATAHELGHNFGLARTPTATATSAAIQSVDGCYTASRRLGLLLRHQARPAAAP